MFSLVVQTDAGTAEVPKSYRVEFDLVDGAGSLHSRYSPKTASFTVKEAGTWQLNVTITARRGLLPTRGQLQDESQKPMIFIAYIGVR